MVRIDWEKIILKEIKPDFQPVLSNDADLKWFDDNPQSEILTPSDEDSAKSVESYQEFNVSWRSSSDKNQIENKNA